MTPRSRRSAITTLATALAGSALLAGPAVAEADGTSSALSQPGAYYLVWSSGGAPRLSCSPFTSDRLRATPGLLRLLFRALLRHQRDHGLPTDGFPSTATTSQTTSTATTTETVTVTQTPATTSVVTETPTTSATTSTAPVTTSATTTTTSATTSTAPLTTSATTTTTPTQPPPTTTSTTSTTETSTPAPVTSTTETTTQAPTTTTSTTITPGVALTHWIPPAALTWYWQLQGSVNNDVPVAAYDIDGLDNPASEVAALHAQGKKVICYIDVGTAESFRSDFASFPASVLGSAVAGYAGELWLDVRALSTLEPIITARLQMCADKGFDAVEPDNMDGYANATGFPLTAADQLTYDEWIAGEAHRLGLAVLQKNDLGQAAQLAPHFDGLLMEQCQQYSECDEAQPYVQAGKPVLDAEYAPTTCPADPPAGVMTAVYDIALDGTGFTPCRPSTG